MEPKTLAKLLQKETRERGWSIDKLAKEAGVSYETARRAKQDIGTIRLTTINKLLKAVGHSINVQKNKT